MSDSKFSMNEFKGLSTKQKTLWGVGLFVVLVLAYLGISHMMRAPAPQRQRVQPVRVAEAVFNDVPVYYQGLGTVTPVNTVLVKSRVDGQIMSLHFSEGQHVEAGDLLAVIDPRPYEVQKAQAVGALAKDEALLKDALLDLARYKRLIKEESVSRQQLQAQEALVGQYRGAVATDKANVADAELQISYCNITAPVSGRLGLKQVDMGNMVRASDSSGIVVITQVKPMQVIFTIVEKKLPQVLAAMRGSGEDQTLTVEAWDQDGQVLLATGKLVTVDNQIDTATGTIKAKAEFANEEEFLFPNQFINAKLLVQTLKEALTVPTSSILRDGQGFFVYRVNAENKTVSAVRVKTGYSDSELSVITEGLVKGDTVVIDGMDRLRNGSVVNY